MAKKKTSKKTSPKKASKLRKKVSKKKKGGLMSKCDSPMYGIGVVGAAVYFWQHGATMGDKLFGILKAMVWPAFAVFKLMEILNL